MAGLILLLKEKSRSIPGGRQRQLTKPTGRRRERARGWLIQDWAIRETCEIGLADAKSSRLHLSRDVVTVELQSIG